MTGQFLSKRFTKIILSFALGFLLAAFVSSEPGWAQDKRQNAPGEFDFYVLSLSWSRRFAKHRVSAEVPDATHRRNVAGGLIRSSCTGFGRNMIAAFRITASVRRRGLSAI